jgi:hypothetical protein
MYYINFHVYNDVTVITNNLTIQGLIEFVITKYIIWQSALYLAQCNVCA